MFKIFVVFMIVALFPVLSITCIVAFASFDAQMLNPLNWDGETRGLAGSWFFLILGIFIIGLIKFMIETYKS